MRGALIKGVQVEREKLVDCGRYLGSEAGLRTRELSGRLSGFSLAGTK